MDSGLIKDDGSIINCPYYEIEESCKKITEIFCSESTDNQKFFLDFANQYTFFEPYFDFVIGELGYSLLNPWLKKDYILCGNYENHRYTLKRYSELLDGYTFHKYNQNEIGFSSDNDLQIKPFDQKTNFYTCFITPNLIELVPNVGGHRELGKQLLNLAMIKDKELCERIAQLDLEKIDSGEILMRYFPLLRFDALDLDGKTFSLVYRSDNISNIQKELIKDLEGLDSDNLIADQTLESSVETIDWSFKFYNKERSENIENKRI